MIYCLFCPSYFWITKSVFSFSKKDKSLVANRSIDLQIILEKLVVSIHTNPYKYLYCHVYYEPIAFNDNEKDKHQMIDISINRNICIQSAQLFDHNNYCWRAKIPHKNDLGFTVFNSFTVTFLYSNAQW